MTTTSLSLGAPAPTFVLPEPYRQRTVSLDELRSPVANLVLFMCNHCPYVKHILDGLIEFGQDYVARDVSIVAINSNDVEEYPDDAPVEMEKLAPTLDFPFLFDETQETAKAYGAACTPDFFLFDGDLKLVYRGQFDGSRPGSATAVTGEDLREACDALMLGRPPLAVQHPAVGCNIKWKRGNEPG